MSVVFFATNTSASTPVLPPVSPALPVSLSVTPVTPVTPTVLCFYEWALVLMAVLLLMLQFRTLTGACVCV